jgi:hypothetical protein
VALALRGQRHCTRLQAEQRIVELHEAGVEALPQLQQVSNPSLKSLKFDLLYLALKKHLEPDCTCLELHITCYLD